MPGNCMLAHRALVISLAAGNKVPAVYIIRIYVGDGGLLSYGPDTMAGQKRTCDAFCLVLTSVYSAYALGDRRIAAGPIVAATGEQAHGVGVAPKPERVAIVLDLVDLDYLVD
jgi:hypothetical protein